MQTSGTATAFPSSTSPKGAALGEIAVLEKRETEAPKAIQEKPKDLEMEAIIQIKTSQALLGESKRKLKEQADILGATIRAVDGDTAFIKSIPILLAQNRESLERLKENLKKATLYSFEDKEAATTLRSHLREVEQLIEDNKSIKEMFDELQSAKPKKIDGITQKGESKIENREEEGKIIPFAYRTPPQYKKKEIVQRSAEKEEGEKENITETKEPSTAKVIPIVSKREGVVEEDRFIAIEKKEESTLKPAPKENAVEVDGEAVMEAVKASIKIHSPEEKLLVPGANVVAPPKTKGEAEKREAEVAYNKLSAREKEVANGLAEIESNPEFAEKIMYIQANVYEAIAKKSEDPDYSPFNILHSEEMKTGFNIIVGGEVTDVRESAFQLVRFISQMAASLGIEEAEPKRHGENMEEFLNTRREKIRKVLKAVKAISS